ncbi:transporter [Clostridium sp. MT-14]|uniref:Transporter n=1 Tax=Clostridium aromativorans TaxID=2836848 RepID=A0ABS8N3Z9_9CLOT|nr:MULTISPECIES: transporter [Clostridium]KAA8672954.1 transporter [Clostridium sp. HV4-5-A1G]MCC9294519.1 transporter [Clostridium aromativorans]CAB1254799.1 Transporter [Clostridiaceae bacterium BL-3]
MKEKIILIFQISAVFIGTVVGAGLASGQEISQFFTQYGYKSFFGILICGIIYIIMSIIVINLSIKYKLNSYDGLILLVSPGFLGMVTNFLTTFFLIGGSSIILAGSGALIHQYFGVSRWVGIFFMVFASIIILFRDTKGLMEINSVIVPSLILVILTLFLLHLIFYKNVNLSFIKSIPYYKNNWLLSSLVYSGFNVLCCSGVLVPLSLSIGKKKSLIAGSIIGALGLTILAFIINFLLISNIPYIFKYEIPLLYIANRFGKLLQTMLLFVIWLEMFSTEVSDVYSVGKNLQEIFNISYNKSVILIILITIPISQIGFINLISLLYPAFGVVSFIFILQCIIFYIREYSK